MSSYGAKQQYNINLAPDDLKMLEDCAAAEKTVKAEIIRRAVRAYWAMRINMAPTCADGTVCRCPHFHQVTPPPRPAA